MSGPATSIVAVAYTRMKYLDTEVLTPRIYGEELAEAKTSSKPTRRTQWTEGSYRGWLTTNAPSSLDKFNLFLDQATNSGFNFIGTAAAYPSCKFPIFDRNNRNIGKISLITYTAANTSIELDLYPLSSLSSQERSSVPLLAQLPEKIAAIPGLEPIGKLLREADFANRKNTPLAELPDASIRELIQTLAALCT